MSGRADVVPARPGALKRQFDFPGFGLLLFGTEIGREREDDMCKMRRGRTGTGARVARQNMDIEDPARPFHIFGNGKGLGEISENEFTFTGLHGTGHLKHSVHGNLVLAQEPVEHNISVLIITY